MIGIIKKILGDDPKETTTTSQEETHIALCVLMIEAAHVDGECSDEEMAHVVNTLTDKFGASKQDITELIEQAYQKRKELLATSTNSYRLLYGEADGMPSFIADVYHKVLVIKLYSAIWFPYLNEILPILIKITSCLLNCSFIINFTKQ